MLGGLGVDESEFGVCIFGDEVMEEVTLLNAEWRDGVSDLPTFDLRCCDMTLAGMFLSMIVRGLYC